MTTTRQPDEHAEPQQPTPSLPAQDRTLADCYREVEGLGPRGAQGPLVERLAEAILAHCEVRSATPGLRTCMCGRTFPMLDDAFEWHVATNAAAEVEAAVSVVRAERDGEVRALVSENRSMSDWASHHASRAEVAEAEARELRAERDALREKVTKVEAQRDALRTAIEGTAMALSYSAAQERHPLTKAAIKADQKALENILEAEPWLADLHAASDDEARAALSDPTTPEPVHWIGDAPTSLHGNGAASFKATSRHWQSVTCALCLSLRERSENWPDPTTPDQKGGE